MTIAESSVLPLGAVAPRPSIGGVSSTVAAAVRNASARTGVDFAYLMEKAAVESGYSPDAKATTSSATGLYQFVDRTWLDMVKEHGAQFGLANYADAIGRSQDGTPFVADPAMRHKILDLRKDPTVSSLLAAQLAVDNKQALQDSVGGTIGPTELYLAHFLGAGGAAKFLPAMQSNPSQAASAVVPDAAQSNRGAFYDAGGKPLSLAQVYNHFAAKFDAATVPGAPTSGQVTVAGGGSSVNAMIQRAKGPMSLFAVMMLSQLGTPLDDPSDPSRIDDNKQPKSTGAVPLIALAG